MSISSSPIFINEAARPDLRRRTALTRAQLEERLYGWGEEVASNAVEVHIHGLRRKIDPGVVRNVRGLGYTLAKDG